MGTYDKKVVTRQIISAWLNVYGAYDGAIRKVNGEDIRWTLDDVISVIGEFIAKRPKKLGEHPHLSNKTLCWIISRIHFCYDKNFDRWFPLDRQDYTEMIKCYYQQEYEDCDYSLAHFMSDTVKLFTYYEAIRTHKSVSSYW